MRMLYLGIDPGTTKSAYVVWDRNAGRVMDMGTHENEMLADWFTNRDGPSFPLCDVCVIEKIESLGMAVGAEVLETVFWSGVFAQAFGRGRVVRIGRRAVKLHLCGSARAKDSNIRAALGDRFGGPSAFKKGGPLYKLNNDERSALAVLLTYIDTQQTEGNRE